MITGSVIASTRMTSARFSSSSEPDTPDGP